MPTFFYKAKDRAGVLHSGPLEIASKKQAMVMLLGKGLQPLSLELKETGKKLPKIKRPVSGNDIILFTEELGELLDAGLPLEPALSSMAGRDQEGAIKQLATSLRNFVTDGIPLHTAMEQTSDRFDNLYINLVRAGEASSSLGSIIKEHALYLKEQASIRNSLVLALLYPAFLLLACLGAICVFMFYLLPQISDLLTTTNSGDMPFGIRLATTMSSLLTSKWPFLVAFIVVTVLGLKWFSMAEKNKAWWDRIKVQLPFYGRVFEYGFFVQWLKTLSNLLINGVPLTQSLSLANHTVSNRHYRACLATMEERVKDGIKLTTAMKQAEIFPSNMMDLIAVGDETGRLARSVQRASEYYETRLRLIMNGLVTVITPIVLIGMAFVVGALCYTLIQAIYDAIGKMRG